MKSDVWDGLLFFFKNFLYFFFWERENRLVMPRAENITRSEIAFSSSLNVNELFHGETAHSLFSCRSQWWMRWGDLCWCNRYRFSSRWTTIYPNRRFFEILFSLYISIPLTSSKRGEKADSVTTVAHSTFFSAGWCNDDTVCRSRTYTIRHLIFFSLIFLSLRL
jgi:hypothetical protein